MAWITRLLRREWLLVSSLPSLCFWDSAVQVCVWLDIDQANSTVQANVFNQSGNHHAGADLDNAYDSDSDSSDVSTIENNASAFRAAQAQRSGAHPADVLDDGSLDACFGIDGEVYEDEDLVVQKREESADDSADDRQMSEVKVEDG